MNREEWLNNVDENGGCTCDNCWASYSEYYGHAEAHAAEKPANVLTPFNLFTKVYDGFESTSDIFRDLREAFDERFNEKAKQLPGEFQGKLTLTLWYSPSEDDPK